MRYRRSRISVSVVVVAAFSLLAAGCGSSPASHVAQLGTTTTTSGTSSTASTQQNGAVAFSRCMRSSGVSKFPDPDSAGDIPKSQLEHLGVSASRFQAAERACRHLLPGGGEPPNQSQLQQIRAQALRFSQCMRAHGVPNFPDPVSTDRERIPDPASVGIDQGSPRFQAANQACGTYRPPYIPSNAAYNAYAGTHG